MKARDQVLILLPTDQNKLLMQWKGPYSVEEVVGVSDYRVRVKGQLKIYHANMLKQYFGREAPPGPEQVDEGVNVEACSAVIEPE